MQSIPIPDRDQPRVSGPNGDRSRGDYGSFETIPPLACDCWRFTRPLGDEPLPDHICVPTMMATLYNDPPRGLVLPDEVEWPVYVGLEPGSPVRELGFVIRQWAQEPPNDMLANQLNVSGPWQTEVESLRGYFKRWEADHPGAPVEDWLDDDTPFPHALRRRNLPATPQTVRHLRACVAGQPKHPEALPARGLLVTTFAYMRTHPAVQSTGDAISVPDPDVRIEGSLELVTGPLFNLVQRIVLSHRDWLRRVDRHPLTDLSSQRRAQRGAFRRGSTKTASLPDDYLQEALNGLPELLLVLAAKRDPRDRQQAEQKYLNAVYYRVSQRLKKLGRPTAPPHGWRDTFRRERVRHS